MAFGQVSTRPLHTVPSTSDILKRTWGSLMICKTIGHPKAKPPHPLSSSGNMNGTPTVRITPTSSSNFALMSSQAPQKRGTKNCKLLSLLKLSTSTSDSTWRNCQAATSPRHNLQGYWDWHKINLSSCAWRAIKCERCRCAMRPRRLATWLKIARRPRAPAQREEKPSSLSLMPSKNRKECSIIPKCSLPHDRQISISLPSTYPFGII